MKKFFVLITVLMVFGLSASSTSLAGPIPQHCEGLNNDSCTLSIVGGAGVFPEILAFGYTGHVQFVMTGSVSGLLVHSECDVTAFPVFSECESNHGSEYHPGETVTATFTTIGVGVWEFFFDETTIRE